MLNILFSKVSPSEFSHYIGMFPKVEKFIIYDLLFNSKPSSLSVGDNGIVEDLSEDPFVVFYKTL